MEYNKFDKLLLEIIELEEFECAKSLPLSS